MSKFCPSCGEELVENAKFCKRCGMDLETMQESPYRNNINEQRYGVPVAEKEHKIAIYAGYALAILVPLFGAIAGIYLLTRKDSENARKHGRYVLIIAVVIWFISVFLVRV